MLVSQLQKNSTVDWLELIKKILPYDVPFTENHNISVSLEYIQSLEQIINNSSKRVLYNYLIWRAVLERINFLPEAIRKQNFKNSRASTRENPNKEDWCILNTYQSLPHVKNLIIYTNLTDTNQINETAKRIKDYILLPLFKLDSDASRKIAATQFNLARPNESVLIKYHKNLSLEENDYLGNSLKTYKHLLDNYYQILNKDGEDWAKEENIIRKPVNFVSSQNVIELSTAILRKPHYYENDINNSTNFGSLGALISQEIINELNLEEKLENYTNRILKVENTFKTRTTEVQDKHYIIDNKIVGSSGIKLAYSAYNNWLNYHKDEEFTDFTPQRLFWVSAVLNWCAINKQDFWKTEDLVKNDFNLEFNSAFGCK
ncbi:hypothetical protein ILUMI_01197 [Ignelater luminosus]|uniref:Peptidase M13 N-terminal domain-containing protein n=1 Tax=Ignelater luminosus TaxID=2038154 RepID=A0A8K0DR66_IGNLU|nr:hypothetical protein ILUMI_01197 [Ignelater luminosus]